MYDPNMKVTWTQRNWWARVRNDSGSGMGSGYYDTLCSKRQAPSQNGGRPIVVRRWVAADGLLYVRQEWAPGKVFTQVLQRRGPAAPEVANTGRGAHAGPL